MTSTFAWLDYSERQRRRMLEVVEMFREEGTVDELGLGAIRDALADRLFPGTSTLHTRPRYLLFIPWIYKEMERDRIGSDRVEAALKRREVRLISALTAGDAGDGIIGLLAGPKLKRFPSILYWNALAAYGIRQFHGSQQQYHRSLDGIYHQRATAVALESDEPMGGGGVRTWDARVPAAPSALLDEANFTLSYAEAEYLQQRFLEHAGGTYLAYLATCEKQTIDGALPWDAPQLATAPSLVQSALHHARNFSELMHGAALLYNLILADKVNQARRTGAELAVDSDRSDEYRARLERWTALVSARADEYSAWDRSKFWLLVREVNPRLSQRLVLFVERWIELAVARRGDVADDAAARALVNDREVAVKRGMARVRNLRALEQWSGASGVGQLSFRWRQGRQYAQDVIDGLARA